MSGTENPPVADGDVLIKDGNPAFQIQVDLPTPSDGLGVSNTENPPTSDGSSLVKGASDQPTPEPDGLTSEDVGPLVEKEVG